MTTIAYRDGMMAADSRAYGGHAHSPALGVKRKLWRLPSGALFAASCGLVGGAEALRDWYVAGASPLDLPVGIASFSALAVLIPTGEVFAFRDSPWPSGPLTAPFYAAGSGEELARGAMWMGADAVTAIIVACALDPSSGPPVRWIRLSGEEGEAEWLRGKDR